MILAWPMETCITIPDETIELDGYPSGGVEINNNTGGYWEVSAYELDNFDSVIFKVLAPDLFYVTGATRDDPATNHLKIEDLEQMAKIEEYSEKYRFTIMPRFI